MHPLEFNTERGTWDEAITSGLANAPISRNGLDGAVKNQVFKPGLHKLSEVENWITLVEN